MTTEKIIPLTFIHCPHCGGIGCAACGGDGITVAVRRASMVEEKKPSPEVTKKRVFIDAMGDGFRVYRIEYGKGLEARSVRSETVEAALDVARKMLE